MNQEENFDLSIDELWDKAAEKSDPETAEERPRPARRRGKRAQKKNPVFRYLVILFAVAFLLLLLSFFAQQRDREALNVDLGNKEETIASLQKENETLTVNLEKAQKSAESATAAAETAETAAETAEKTAQALEYLAQMERACRTSYVEGYHIAQEMESKGLAQYLPTSSSVSGCVSPAKVYQSLCNTIFGTLG